MSIGFIDEISNGILTRTYSNGTTIQTVVGLEIEEPVILPSQLDRIEEKLNKNTESIKQQAQDALMLELIEGGII